ncbi:interleukin-1 receptor accessory protein-like [Sander vitreus]
MKVKILLLPLFCLLTLLTGVCPRRPREIYVKEGEMVALYCPRYRGYDHGDAKLIWTRYTTQDMDLTNNVSSAEQRQMGILVHERSLVILSASVNHQGNYSCSQGNASTWFRLTVLTPQSREYENMTQYPTTCYTEEAFTLHCPDVNIPAENIPNITSNGIIWHKEGESLPTHSYFSSVEENDHGVYTCTRSYLCYGQIYNMTFTLLLDVKQKVKPVKDAAIREPQNNHVFHVDLGSTKVIDCKAVIYSDFDEVFWLIGKSFVETDNSLPVFYNYTWNNNTGKIMTTVSLIFKKVSEEDLSKNYTCKLESVSGHSSFVTINLAQKSRPSYLSLALGIVVIVVVMVLTVVIYVRFKINITLFLRDTIGCHSSTSDGKSYDAFLIWYKSNTDAGLHEEDRKELENVLEERFGYGLCLYDRDVLPGKAVAEAVLDCIEQSRTVVLVPTSPDPGPGSGLLSAIHEALVERQTRLVFIKTETTDVLRSGLLPEALQLLGEAGDCVTWKGISSMQPSSSFWKQLRYYLPSPQHAPKVRLLPQSIQDGMSL